MKEIDDACRVLEACLTEAGDLISYEYRTARRLLDSMPLSPDQIPRLVNCINRLNKNAGTTAAYLGPTALRDGCNLFADHVNERASETGVKDRLQPLDDEVAKRASLAGRFR